MSTKVGISCGVVAFVIFGLYPIYLKQINDVPAVQLTLHRIVWSFVTVLPIFIYKREWNTFKAPQIFSRSNILIYIGSITAVGGSWLLYVWGVTSDNIVETSLGYFINPVISLVLAILVFREQLRLWQGTSIFLAFSGVLVVAIAYGKFPGIGIGIGATLAMYALTKKKSPLSAVASVTLEMGVLSVPSLIALIVFEYQGVGVLKDIDAGTWWLLIGTGITTVVPLLLFSTAAQMISFTIISIIQYVGPVLTFFVGVFIYGEPFSTMKLIGFILVWLALILFAIEGVIHNKQSKMESSSVITVVENSPLSPISQSPSSIAFTKVNSPIV